MIGALDPDSGQFVLGIAHASPRCQGTVTRPACPLRGVFQSLPTAHRGCPDECSVSGNANGGGEQATGFRCRVHQMVAQALLEEQESQLWQAHTAEADAFEKGAVYVAAIR